MRKASTLFLLIAISVSTKAFEFPKDYYLSYKFTEGEKLKEIAEMFNVPLQRFIDQNKLFLNAGAKPGEQIKIAMVGITSIIGSLNGEDYRLLWLESSPPDTESATSNGEEELRIGIESINNGLLNISNKKNLDGIKITFSDGKVLDFYDQEQIKLLLQSVQRIHFLRANNYMTFNRL